MSWFEIEDMSLWFYVVVGIMAVAAIGLLVFVWWSSRVERRRVQRYVESHGGEVLSIERVGLFRPGSGYALHDSVDQPWQLQPDTPSYHVRWRNPQGVERSATFKTQFFRRSVWTDTPLHDTRPDLPPDLVALEADNASLRDEIAGCETSACAGAWRTVSASAAGARGADHGAQPAVGHRRRRHPRPGAGRHHRRAARGSRA